MYMCLINKSYLFIYNRLHLSIFDTFVNRNVNKHNIYDIIADLCNHNRSWQLLTDALKYPESLLASYAKNYRTWKNYSVGERNRIVLEIGKYYKENV